MHKPVRRQCAHVMHICIQRWMRQSLTHFNGRTLITCSASCLQQSCKGLLPRQRHVFTCKDKSSCRHANYKPNHGVASGWIIPKTNSLVRTSCAQKPYKRPKRRIILDPVPHSTRLPKTYTGVSVDRGKAKAITCYQE